MAKAPFVLRDAIAQIKPATDNLDGTKTHFVEMGFSKGEIDLMRQNGRAAEVGRRPAGTIDGGAGGAAEQHPPPHATCLSVAESRVDTAHQLLSGGQPADVLCDPGGK